jgi:nodulation protein A
MGEFELPEANWSTPWEDDISGAQHEALAELLRRCFPGSRAGFAGATSWASARPELRIVAMEGERPVAHLGILRRFLQVGGTAQLVGDVGLVAVDPQRRGRRLGAELLDRAAATLHDLDLPFGFLTCGEQVAGFYAAGHWVRVANPVRMVRADGRVQVYGGVAMALPVHAGMDDWLVGGRVDRNGYEL